MVPEIIVQFVRFIVSGPQKTLAHYLIFYKNYVYVSSITILFLLCILLP